MNIEDFKKLKQGMMIKIVKIDDPVGSNTYNELKHHIGKIYQIKKISIEEDDEYVTIKDNENLDADFYPSEIERPKLKKIEQQTFQDTFNPEELVT